MYYTCKDCHTHFTEPTKYTDKHGFNSPPYDTKYGCPICEGDYAFAIECDECGRRMTGEYIKTNSGQRVCEDCYIEYEFGEEIM